MRKKFLALLCVFAVIFAAAGCAASSAGTEETAASENGTGAKNSGQTEEAESGTEKEEADGAEDGAVGEEAAGTEGSTEGEMTAGEETAETGNESAAGGGASQAESEGAPAEDGTEWEWQHDTPENHGVDTAMLESLHAGLDTFPILTSVIVRDGYIVDEYYKEGYDADSVFVLNSCSKSITSALVGIAIDEGYIAGTDVLISEYFPQILESGDENWQKITIWHLLTHTSGVDWSDTQYWDAWRGSENWVDFALSRPVTSEPGTVFNYSTQGSHLLSAIIQEATGMTAYEFAREHLFGPVGMDSAQCSADPQGISDGGNGFAMNVYDMAKFGYLYLHDGMWEGEQIVPAEWVEESTSLQFKRSTGSADYGYQWWVRTFGDQGYDAYFGQGHAGQYIFVVPELELVVAMTSDYTGSTGIYWDFMNSIVNGCEAGV